MDKIIKYGLIILKNKSFLINRKYNTTLFLLPGGKPEKNETIEKCLIREIEEECAVDLDLNSISFLGDFQDLAANEPNTIISMKVYVGKIIGEPKPSSEIEEQKWFKKGDDVNILSAILKNKILPVLIEKKLI